MRAYTLVEILAVIGLVALVAASLAPALTGATASSRLDSAVLAFADLDARARLLARSESAVLIRKTDRNSFILATESTPSLSIWRAPTDMQAELRDEGGRTLDHVRYDGAGRSVDFILILGSESASRVLRIAGLTGWTETVEEPSP